jgi:BON domain
MTIREFWRDVKGRFLEGRHPPHEDRWYERGEPFGPEDDWRRDRGNWASTGETYSRKRWPRDVGYDEYRDSGLGAGPGIGGPEITSGFFDVNRADIAPEPSREQDFRGLGPRNVTRADDRIREDVCEALMDDEDLDASEIEVSVKEGEVTLVGKVASRLDKRLAEDLSANVSGVRDVNNQLRTEL